MSRSTVVGPHSHSRSTSHHAGRVDPCPRCGNEESWRLSDGRRRCARCRFDWRPGRLPLRLTEVEWRRLLEWFVRGGASRQIAAETGLERKRVLRALTVVRNGLLGRTRAVTAARSVPAGRPVFGVSVSGGEAFADVLPESVAQEIRSRIRRRKVPDATLFAPHQAVIYSGRFYRSEPASPGDARFGQLEAFWSYVQQRLRSKGGVRRSRADLYLAEYTWRFNHRRATRSEQVEDLLMRLRRVRVGGADVS